MSTGAQITRNSFLVLLAQLVRLASNVVVFIAIARLYGPTAFGQFTAAHTLSTIFILVADFGFDILLSSEIARDRARGSQLAHTYLTMKLLFATAASIIMAVVAGLQDVSEATRFLMKVFTCYVFFSSITNFFFSLFKSYEEMHHEVRISFTMNLVLLLAVLVLGFTGQSLGWLAAAFVVSRVIGFAMSLPVANRLVRFRLAGLRLAGTDEFKRISIFGLYALFGYLFFMQDTLLLAAWTGDREVGIYQAVLKITSLALMLSDIAFYSLLPVLTRLHATETDRWHRLIRLLHKTLVSVGGVVGFTMIVFAEPMIGTIYGLSSFQASVPILRVFGLIVFIRYIGEASATTLTTSRRQASRMVITGIAVVLNYVLNVYTIPRYGAFGAALASLATNAAVVTGYVLVARQESLRWFAEARTYAGVMAALITGGAIFAVSVNPPFALGGVAFIVVAVTSYFGIFTQEERKALFETNMLGLFRRPQ